MHALHVIELHLWRQLFGERIGESKASDCSELPVSFQPDIS